MTKESAVDLRALVDTVQVNLRALETQRLPVDTWDAILGFYIIQRLDPETRKQWEVQLTSNNIPEFKKLMEFLLNRCRMLESIESNGVNVPSSQTANKSSGKLCNKFTTKSFALKVADCPLCHQKHGIYHCEKFIALNPYDRKNKARDLKLCYKCLGNHTKDCSSKSYCKICKDSKHNTLLHFQRTTNTNQSSDQSEAGSSVSCENANRNIQLHCKLNKQNNIAYKNVVMSTAVILIKDIQDNWMQARVLLDSASQSCFATEEFIRLTGLKPIKTCIAVCGINKAETTIKNKVYANIKSRISNYEDTVEFLVVKNITSNIPSVSIDTSRLELPVHIPLADPRFYESSKIDLLLGTEIFYQILRPGRVRLSVNNLYAFESLLGYFIGGIVMSSNDNRLQQTCHCYVSTQETSNVLANSSNVFCDVYIDKHQEHSVEAIMCEVHFQQTTKRANDGKYSVRLPLKADHALGNSRNSALQQFYRLEHRLNHNSTLKAEYCKFMEAYHSLNHMERADAPLDPSRCYYIPHHPVFKPGSTTTKMRVVFNASAKSSNGKSLNDILNVGPTIQRSLVTIVLAFTKHQYVFVADIEKMYRQIWIDEKDRDYLRIFWYDEQHNIQEYCLRTVTYGTSCAPFQATRTLLKIAEDNGQSCRDGGKLLQDFYMDDIMSGGNNVMETKSAIHELISLLKNARMKLRKFASNSPELLRDIPDVDIEQLIEISNHENAIATLGLVWNPNLDRFMFKIPTICEPKHWTKRLILSEWYKIFDPAGWLNPVKLLGNLILQKLWIDHIGWDEVISGEVLQEWKLLRQELPVLHNVQKDRLIFKSRAVEVHGYCDASIKAYGAVIYIRSKVSHNQYNVELLCSQMRIAPQSNKKRKKPITMPRLELNAAYLLSQLLDKVIIDLKLSCPVYLWSDSQIVLSWIKKPADQFVKYISRRVEVIHRLTKNYVWNYIPSSQNPADVISRGMKPTQIVNNNLWWHGPAHLFDPEFCVVSVPIANDNIIIEEVVSTCHITTSKVYLFDITKYSSYTKMIRIMAWCLRFIQNCRTQEKQHSPLSVHELQAAEVAIIKQVQSECFQPEIINLIKHNQLPHKSSLSSLQPILQNGVLKVGGRLHHAKISDDSKHQIILPSSHHFTKLLIQNTHEKTLHGGPQLVINTIRQRYWPIRARSAVKFIIRRCVTCFRRNPTTSSQIMGVLPPDRVQPSRPFSIVGLDYCGPFMIQAKLKRPTTLLKIWCCIFVCYATKAVHMEPVADLTTAAFMNCLRRFIARRGKCVVINSDNQSTFHSADTSLKELKQFFMNQHINDEIKDLCTKDDINWKFIPARCPHIGGLWESAVKSFKHHLKRVTHDTTHLTFEEFNTLICQIEACLNSRPLTPMSDDPEDSSVLTPGHFLIGQPINAILEPDIQHIPYNRLKRFQRIQKMLQVFWKNWQLQYLHTLQQRFKWRITKKELKIGELVLLKEDNLPPTEWLMGRIIGLSKGVDDIVRMVDIRLSNRTTRRSVHRICPLPISDD